MTAEDNLIVHQRIKVESSNIDSYRYDAETQIFEIQFKTKDGKPGSVYRHYRVPAELHDRWLAAHSKGAFYAQELRSKFDYQPIDPPAMKEVTA